MCAARAYQFCVGGVLTTQRRARRAGAAEHAQRLVHAASLRKLHILMSSAPTAAPPSLEERLLAAEARAAAAETKLDRATYRILHLTKAYDAHTAELAALRAAAASTAASSPPPK